MRHVGETTPSRGKTEALAMLVIAVPLMIERAILVGRSPTAADETLYLMQALDWLGRFIKLSPDVHRTWGVPVILVPLAAVSSSVTLYRTVFALIGLALCLVVYRIGRRFLEPIPAIFAALMLGLASTSVLGSVLLLPDMAAALGVAFAFLFYWSRVVHIPPDERPARLWPIGVAVGSVLYFNIAFSAFVAMTIGLDYLLFRRRDLISRATFGAVVALGLTIAPYFGVVTLRYGNPLHTVRIGLSGVGGTSRAGEKGYALYARWFFDPDRFFGGFWGWAVLIGIAVLVFAIARGTPIPRRDAAAVGIWLVVPTLMTAFLFHAEARYMLPWLAPFFFALALPAQAAVRASRSSARATAILTAATVVLVAGAAQFGVAQYHPASRTMTIHADTYDAVHALAERLPARDAKPPCRIYARFPREFELHTGCNTSYYNKRTEEILLHEAPAFENATFYVTFTKFNTDAAYQPRFLNGFFARYALKLFTMDAGKVLGTATVYRYVPRS